LPDGNFTVARTDAANAFIGHQTIEGVTSTGATGMGKFVFDTSPVLTTPSGDTITATTAFRAANGSSGAPSISFTNSTNSGLAWVGSTVQIINQGGVQLSIQQFGTTIAYVTDSPVFRLSSGPTWTKGTGAPSGACVTGSFYSRTDGTSGATFYACEATTWAAK
jgi:hypothetical protein